MRLTSLRLPCRERQTPSLTCAGRPWESHEAVARPRAGHQPSPCNPAGCDRWWAHWYVYSHVPFSVPFILSSPYLHSEKVFCALEAVCHFSASCTKKNCKFSALSSLCGVRHTYHVGKFCVNSFFRWAMILESGFPPFSCIRCCFDFRWQCIACSLLIDSSHPWNCNWRLLWDTSHANPNPFRDRLRCSVLCPG